MTTMEVACEKFAAKMAHNANTKIADGPPRGRFEERWSKRHLYAYRCPLPGGFIQQLACCYLRDGYIHYVLGTVRPGKDPTRVDEQILDRYDIRQTKDTRYKLLRKNPNAAKVQYLRCGSVYVIVATPGEHFFYDNEKNIRIASKRQPIRVFGHSICRDRGHTLVRIDAEVFWREWRYFRETARKWSVERLETEFTSLPYEKYEPVKKQLRQLWRMLNRERKRRGQAPLSKSGCRLDDKRTIYKPFAPLQQQRFYR